MASAAPRRLVCPAVFMAACSLCPCRLAQAFVWGSGFASSGFRPYGVLSSSNFPTSTREVCPGPNRRKIVRPVVLKLSGISLSSKYAFDCLHKCALAASLASSHCRPDLGVHFLEDGSFTSTMAMAILIRQCGGKVGVTSIFD
eukprot:CAMPEP_0117673284 /NCGR_PEP_ID=MMETSP0804-20121206/14388_1 /TAXON_ID=1074897 /ORGANISM="Tetraselmis astigmatica, Strain CCMP880" /LENGTH=142 /DNA_ID=CAMNT_0005482007 /DNA_START=169 /DNA_END=597 /DNA_ORIENTATION=-